MKKLADSQSKFFLAALVSFIAGVGAASLFGWGRANLFWLVWAFGLAGFTLFLVQKRWRVLVVLVIFLLVGAWRFVISEPKNEPANLRFYVGRFGIIGGRAAGAGEITGGHQRFYFLADGIKFFAADNYKKIGGRAVIYADKYPLISPGEKLELKCNLVDPASLGKEGSFSYSDYLKKERIWTACFNTQIVSRGENDFSWRKILPDIKNYFNHKINHFLPEPHSSFLRGLLYGDRGSMPDYLQEAFSKTGVTHIIAISGYNITIIAAALLIVCKIIKISRRHAFWFVAAIIIFFVFLTGASASVCRAAVMGLLVLWGRRVGRGAEAGRLLVLAAFLMLLFNPRLLFFDMGFQLSFLSTTGLIYLTPVLARSLARFSERFGFKEIIITTFSAIIFTMPFITHAFGRFSLIAPLANLLILPAVPLAMFSGFVTLLAGIIFMPLGHILAYLSWVILGYIIGVAEFLAGWEFSSVNLFMPAWLMILFYGILIYVIYVHRKKDKI